ncbi:hypothetical protein BKA70DRAFT_1230963 [Coprinopsis sp. MPI-PUGE-AT-0042]|nr:hypothetical protein BKA70DRAFT_1230963 [Coprinopsis sp. MPI-PUGE-AT-0042]
MAAIDNSPTYLAIKDRDLDKLAKVMSGTMEDEWFDIGQAVAVAAEVDPANTTDHLRLFKSPRLPEWTAYRELTSIKRNLILRQPSSALKTAISLGACCLDVQGEKSCATVQILPEKSPRGSSIQLCSGLGLTPILRAQSHRVLHCHLAAGAKVFGDETFKDRIYTRQEFSDALGRLNAIQNPIGLRFFEVSSLELSAIKALEKNDWEPALSSQEIWEMFSPEA